VRAGGDEGELRPWHFIYVYSTESRLIMAVRYALEAMVPFSAAREGCEDRIGTGPHRAIT